MTVPSKVRELAQQHPDWFYCINIPTMPIGWRIMKKRDLKSGSKVKKYHAFVSIWGQVVILLDVLATWKTSLKERSNVFCGTRFSFSWIGRYETHGKCNGSSNLWFNAGRPFPEAPTEESFELIRKVADSGLLIGPSCAAALYGVLK